MDVDRAKKIFQFDEAEVQSFSLEQAEWSFAESMDMISALQIGIRQRFSNDPSDFPAGSARNQVYNEYLAGFQLRRYYDEEILPYVLPELDRQLLDTVAEVTKRQS